MTNKSWNSLFNSDDPIIRRIASIIYDAKQAYDKGELTKSQFEEIIEDTTEIKKFKELTNSLDRKVAVHNAIQIMMQLISFIPK